MNSAPLSDSTATPDPSDPSADSIAPVAEPGTGSNATPHTGSTRGSSAGPDEASSVGASTTPHQGSDTGFGTASNVARRLVVLPKHLHARPAGQVARVAARHRAATIELVAGERRANAISVLSVMGLGAVTGTEVGVVVTGPQAEAIADELSDILRSPEPEAE
ncbi:HPr family phosphocarrier protein [Thermopolyspora sp. NPDC052614]|uniref:HPr family phosphocarrier protein n=1 Tax=Thermopolyspora sp. NPDC052614 TaxID=3155682 RepID=UPI00342A5A98